MSKKKWITGSLMIALVLGGCAAPLKRSGVERQVSLDIVPTAVASVSEVGVVQEGEDLVVSGTVKKYQEFFLPGHVDIAICDPQGNVIARETPRLTGYSSKKGGVREGRFSAKVKMTPPAGSTIRVRYHAPGSEEEHLEVCTKHEATPERQRRNRITS